VTDSEAVFKLAPSGPDERGADVRMTWVGADASARVVAADPLPGKSNYLVGNDPKAWKSDIPTFGRVQQENAYPGVNLEFYGKGDLLEYDIVVKPGADPRSVRLRFSGSDDVRVDDESGDLVMSFARGELRHQKAVVYQPTSSGKQGVESHYAVTADGDVAFELGDYDRSEKLIIDPVVTFVRFIGGSVSDDQLAGLASDSSGAVFAAGTTSSINFAPLVSPLDGTYNGQSDIFVTKFDPATGVIAYSTFIGSPTGDIAAGIDVDSQGSAYVTGFTNDAGFPTTAGAYRVTLGGGADTFVCKLSPSGGSLSYSTFFGGSSNDTSSGIAVDQGGQAVVVGQTASVNLDTLSGAFDRTLDGTSDGFVARFDASGTALIQATYLGGTGPDSTDGVDLTSAGDVLVVGRTSSVDFPTTPGVFDQSFSGGDEGFVTRLSPGLSSTAYSTMIGRAGDDRVMGVAVDFADRATITGTTNSTDFPTTPGAPQVVFGGGSGGDGFVARISPTGSSLEFCTYVGGASDDACKAIRTDASGALVVAGSTSSPEFVTTVGASDRVLGGPRDAFVVRYTVLGAVSFSTFLGGNASEDSQGLALTVDGRVAVGGRTRSWNFPTTTSFTGQTADGQDCFVTELSANGSAITFSTLIGGSLGTMSGTLDRATAVSTMPDGTIVLVGKTTSVGFPTIPGGIETSRGNEVNAFVVRVASDGQSLLTSTVFGGTGFDDARDVAFTASGSIVIVGSTDSSDFPTTPGAVDTTIAGGDAYIFLLSSDGRTLQISTFLGGTSGETGAAVAVDMNDAVYVYGTTGSPSFPITPGAFDSTFSGTVSEAFVAKLDSSLSNIVYATFLGGNSSEVPYAIAVDGFGSAVVTGQTTSDNYPVTAGAFQTTNQGGPDVFVTKLGPMATTASFSTYLGTAGGEQPGGIAFDASGNIVISGATNSSLFPTTPGAYDRSFNGGFVDGFVLALNPTGNQLVFSTFFGGNDDDVFYGLVRDSGGGLWVCGNSHSTDLPFPPNAFDRVKSGQTDGLLVALDPLATTLRYATFLGGSGFETLYDIAIGTEGDIVVAGESNSSDPSWPVFGQADTSSIIFARFVVAADTVGIYVAGSGAWFPRFVNASGPASLVFTYGAGGSGLVPLAGNWDGAAGDSPGLYDPSTGAFFLRNSNSPGPADVVFTFGPGGSDFVPLAGDWNGDGTDTIGIYSLSSGAFFLRNSNAGGPADQVFSFGPGGSGFTPVAGDWNGDETETVGIYQTATGAFFLRNANAGGGADLVFTFGAGGAGIIPVTGDWNGDGTDTIGIVLQSSGFFFLRDSNTAGPANYAFGYGAGGETPVVGNWAG
jgi:hypothetical protein